MSELESQTSLTFAKDLLILVVKICLSIVESCARWVIPKSKKSLKGEVVLVTGAGHGLGRELAKEFAKHQAKVVLWDINEETVTSVALEINDKGGNASAYVCDVTDEDDVISTARRVQEKDGAVTILVNNAGIIQNLPMLQLSSQGILNTFGVNILAHFWTIRAFLPNMLKNNKGHIVAVSSLSTLYGTVNFSDYSASKHAIGGLMESLEEEMRMEKKNISFTTICPAAMETAFVTQTSSRYPLLFPIMSPRSVASKVIEAIQREEFVVGVPSYMYHLLLLGKIFPRKAMVSVFDFGDYCRLPNDIAAENGGKVKEPKCITKPSTVQTSNGYHCD